MLPFKSLIVPHLSTYHFPEFNASLRSIFGLRGFSLKFSVQIGCCSILVLFLWPRDFTGATPLFLSDIKSGYGVQLQGLFLR